MAFIHYMAGVPQTMISEYVRVTEKTISDWAGKGSWKNKRSAATVTRPELINKILQSIGNLLDDALNGNGVSAIEDKLAKYAKTIEALDKKNNPINAMEWFKKLNDHILSQVQYDRDATPHLVKTINKFQISFINLIMTNE